MFLSSYDLGEAMARGIREGFRDLRIQFCFKRDKARLQRQALKLRDLPTYDTDYEKEAIALAALVVKFFSEYKVTRKD